MAEFLYRTKGNASPQGKARVYVTAHPEDLGLYFDKICEDIFKTQDVAIYYTADLSASFDEATADTDLLRMNLFVVPVTYRLLCEDSRAKNFDLPYACAQNIPILPLMMDTGLDEVYASSSVFGTRQYLSPFSSDTSAIGYEEKLGKYLEAVLISDELAERVREAFDAYVFLSYRKKDRRFATELMKLIHANPECRDIAIWYDEFLTPGESFEENIRRALEKSELLALLVTPSVLEEPDGKPNYVMGVEYPMARAAGLAVLPCEMEATDRDAMCEKFPEIPHCIDARDEASLRENLLASLSAVSAVAKRENDSDPEHIYLIGCAYLDGIDVEVNRARGLALILEAAEAGYHSAMLRAYGIYSEGLGVPIDYEKAAYWAKRIIPITVEHCGEESRPVVIAYNMLATAYSHMGEYREAAKVQETTVLLSRRALGEEHPETIAELGELAEAYLSLGEYEKALGIAQEVYALWRKVGGEDDPHVATSLYELAKVHSALGDYRRALEMGEAAYQAFTVIFGDEHPMALMMLHSIASFYTDLYGARGEYQKELALEERTYAILCERHGDRHPSALALLYNIAVTYEQLGDYDTALEKISRAYRLSAEVLGDGHPDTLRSLFRMGALLATAYRFDDALAILEEVYAQYTEIFGEKHPDTLGALSELAGCYGAMGDSERALAALESVYAGCVEVLGETHPRTLTALGNLAVGYESAGELDRALALQTESYEKTRDALGKEHADTLLALSNVAHVYYSLGEYPRALSLQREAYDGYCRILGEDHPTATGLLTGLFELCLAMRDLRGALDYGEKFYASLARLLGEEHPEALELRGVLDMLRAQGS